MQERANGEASPLSRASFGLLSPRTAGLVCALLSGFAYLGSGRRMRPRNIPTSARTTDVLSRPHFRPSHRQYRTVAEPERGPYSDATETAARVNVTQKIKEENERNLVYVAVPAASRCVNHWRRLPLPQSPLEGEGARGRRPYEQRRYYDNRYLPTVYDTRPTYCSTYRQDYSVPCVSRRICSFFFSTL